MALLPLHMAQRGCKGNGTRGALYVSDHFRRVVRLRRSSGKFFTLLAWRIIRVTPSVPAGHPPLTPSSYLLDGVPRPVVVWEEVQQGVPQFEFQEVWSVLPSTSEGEVGAVAQEASNLVAACRSVYGIGTPRSSEGETKEGGTEEESSNAAEAIAAMFPTGQRLPKNPRLRGAAVAVPTTTATAAASPAILAMATDDSHVTLVPHGTPVVHTAAGGGASGTTPMALLEDRGRSLWIAIVGSKARIATSRTGPWNAFNTGSWGNAVAQQSGPWPV